MDKKIDTIDIVLAGGFLITLGTICYMMMNGQAVPEVLQNIFWFIGGGLGLKKVPTVI